MISYCIYLAVATLVLIYYVLAVSIIAKWSRVWTFCIPAIAGVGAYTAAILSTAAGMSPGLALMAGATTSMVLGGTIGLALAKMRADHASVASLAVQVIGVAAFQNWSALTHGALGIAGIPGFHDGAVSNAQGTIILALLGVPLAACVGGRWQLRRKVWRHIETAQFESPDFLTGLGWPVARARATAWAAASLLAGFAAGLWAQFVTFIDPSSFASADAILVVCLAIVAAHSLHRTIVISLVFTLLPALFRIIGVSGQLSAAINQILFGTAIVLIAAVAGHRETKHV